MYRLARTAILLLLLFYGQPALADTQSEHIDWGRWSFDWEVRDNNGLALRDVRYAGELVLSKASLPVIRVKYVKERVWWNPFTWFGSRAESGRCGPFQDRLRWQDLVPIVNCGNQKICIETTEQGGVKWLELGVYARIGEYHLYQSWHLSDDGEIRPVLQSRGSPAIPTTITIPIGVLISISTATAWIRCSSMTTAARMRAGAWLAQVHERAKRRKEPLHAPCVVRT
ncbi:MAG: hypothetical protein U0231_08625 [Nitrospiraceae bacterium]